MRYEVVGHRHRKISGNGEGAMVMHHYRERKGDLDH